ncbi:MAG: VIT1/CCC1 transporter family protein [Candidatus Margulisbacteria bacterium]|nr:VIT1/CCC1 transporter family protein [Candidatus Margulisiibacteriota bacterium]
MLDTKLKQKILEYQKNEITEAKVYRYLAKHIRDDNNRNVILKIAADEEKHYQQFKEYTGRDVKMSLLRFLKYIFISRFLGLTFGIKLMEHNEENTQENYIEIRPALTDIQNIIDDETIHEKELLSLVNEEKLKYTSSMILGLNDALVELAGALAGFTLVLEKTSIIALAGLVTGIAAAFSMAASEYLSVKHEVTDKKPLPAAFFTGTAYLFTVIALVLPFFFISQRFISLAVTLSAAVCIIFIFNFYISVAKELNFKRQFLEMVTISLSVAAASFFIGFLLKQFIGVDI